MPRSTSPKTASYYAWTLFLAAAGCSSPAALPPASDATPPPNKPDAKAIEVTEHMLARYKAAHSYADHATYVERKAYRGEGVEHELPFYQMSLAFERPNKLRFIFDEAIAGSTGRKGYDIASDGERMRAAVKEISGQMQETPAPAELTAGNLFPDPVIREAFHGRSLGDVFPQLAMLLNKDDDSLVFPDDEHPRLLGDDSLDGRKCYRVATSNPEGTRVLWIDSENYALRRMELPVEAHRKTFDPEHNYINLAVRIDFEDPMFDLQIDAAAFKLPVPEGAHVVAKLEPPTAEAKYTKGDEEKNH